MTTSILSEKGWVVIPQEIRERYGFKKGDKFNVIDYGGVISIIPVSKDPIKAARGMLKGGPSLTKALLESRREDAARDK
ncbi:MAG: AbrB/MazE/SpoVT family DNA-binding domain-containing protein [Chloroflexota bacterium]